MWLGEQITAKGVGNGISIIIFAGLLLVFRLQLTRLYDQYILKVQGSIVH